MDRRRRADADGQRATW